MTECCSKLNLLLTCLLLIGSATPSICAERPNVVLIMTDDQGFGDVGLHGNDKIDTPHLDRFAREGVELTRFYCSPVCSPTRSSLMTGRYHYRTGVIHTSRGGAKMHGGETIIAELLAKAGYATGIFGKWHLGDNYPMRPQDQGFGESLWHRSGGIGQPPDLPNNYFNPLLWRGGKSVKSEGYCTDVFTTSAIEFIEKNQKRPFFVYLPTNAPHTPLEVAEELVAPHRAKGLDDTTARVYAMCENIDQNVGRLLAKLDELGLRENTLVVFLTDNGPQQNRYTAGLRGRKASTYEGGIRVPCYVQWPKRFAGKRRVDRIAAHIDMLPTILAACGVTQPSELKVDGVNLLPLLDGEQARWPERKLFFQVHRGLEPKRYQNCAVVTQRYKLVGSPGTFGREDFEAPDRPALELYDLQVDAGESRDLAASDPKTLAELKAAYDAWFDSVRDSRQFEPGVIQLGSDAENPTRLCYYQDGTWRDGASLGWLVEVLRGGRYRATIRRGDSRQRGSLQVRWLDREQSAPLAADESAAVFELATGKGLLDIWFQEDGQPRRNPGVGDRTLGDVDLERLK